jgi:DNA-directed RNA polymerase specialized sigma subunit
MGKKVHKNQEALSFLLQLRKIDKLIENKLIEIEQWKSMATDITARMGGDRVKSSGSQTRMADAVERYVDIEAEIKRDVDRLMEAKKDVVSVIEQLHAQEYDILHKIYVQYFTFYEVADILGISYSAVTTAHGRALKNVQHILNSRKKGEDHGIL